MSDITKEQIQRLEAIGIAIVDKIEAEYESCQSRADTQNSCMHDLFDVFKKTMEQLDKEDRINANRN